MTENEKTGAQEIEAQALRSRLVSEYHQLTDRIVRAEAQMHATYAKGCSDLNETKVNEQLSMQIDSMKKYRWHLMRRMALLGIDLKTTVN